MFTAVLIRKQSKRGKFILFKWSLCSFGIHWSSSVDDLDLFDLETEINRYICHDWMKRFENLGERM